MFWFSSRIHKQRVIPVFRGGKRTCIEGRNSQRSLYFLRRDLGIHYSGPNLDSGLFRVIQYHASTRGSHREKTGMTLLGVVYHERGNALIRAFLTLPLLFSVELSFVAPKAPLLPGEVPEEA